MEFKPLSEVSLLITDGSHWSPKDDETSSIPMLSVKDMDSNGFNYSNCKHVSKEDFGKLKSSGCVPKKNDVLITKDGNSYLQQVFVVKDEIEQAILSSIGVIRPDPNKIDPYFLKYYLSNEEIKQQVGRNFVSGSAIPRIILDDFAKFPILIPPMEKQQEIAHALKTFDDFIEVNKKEINLLEILVKQIYHYWFLQFDFPDENGKPYRASGGKMVWNEELKREIPEGWKVGMLSDLCFNVLSPVSPKDALNKPYTPLDSIPKKQLTFGKGSEDRLAASSLIEYQRNDILLGAMRPYFHRVCVAPFDGITRTTTLVIRGNGGYNYPFIYSLINMDSTISYATQIATGTQQPYVQWNNGLEKMKTVIPPVSVVKRFSELTGPLIEYAISLEKEKAELEQLQNFLLPLLMNGQVAFKEEAETASQIA